MSKLTEVLKLFCYDPETDGNLTFNVTEALTKNWEKIDQLVLLAVAAAAAYDPEGSYAVGDYCTHGGGLHKCNTAIPDGEPWTADHWTETSVAAELAEVRTSLSNKLEIHSNNSAGLDCNLLINDGRYQMQGQLVNSPPWNNELAGHFFIDVFHHADNWVRQVAYEVTSDQVYTRSMLDYTWGKWLPFSTATPPQKQNISLLNGVQPTDSGCVFWKQQDNVCTVAIACTKPTDGLTPDMIIGTLPVGFRPSYIERVGYADTSSAQTFSAVLRIYEDGNIQIWFPNTSANVFVAEASFPVLDNGGAE